jgi:hypothetical protein
MMKGKALFIIVAMLLLPVLAWAGGCPKPGYGTGKAYEHTHCGGWWVALSTKTYEADLRKFGSSGQNINDMISSIDIGPGIECEFYTDINFKGKLIGPMRGERYWDGEKSSLNDKISSIKCRAL